MMFVSINYIGKKILDYFNISLIFFTAFRNRKVIIIMFQAFFKTVYLGVINNVVVVSVVQQCDSVIHVHVCLLSHLIPV